MSALGRWTVLLCSIIVLLAGCGAKAEHSYRGVALDVSGSFFAEGEVRDQRLADAKRIAGESIASMTGPGTMTFQAFSGQVGGACPGLVAKIGEDEGPDDGDTQFEDLKVALSNEMVALIPKHVGCVLAGTTKGSSDVFGAINVLAKPMAGQEGNKAITVITDGCQSNSGTKLCSAKTDISTPEARAKIIAALPDGWRPDLNGVSVCMVGLGLGQELEQIRIDQLERFYSEYVSSLGGIYKCESE